MFKFLKTCFRESYMAASSSFVVSLIVIRSKFSEHIKLWNVSMSAQQHNSCARWRGGSWRRTLALFGPFLVNLLMLSLYEPLIDHPIDFVCSKSCAYWFQCSSGDSLLLEKSFSVCVSLYVHMFLFLQMKYLNLLGLGLILNVLFH